jgi:hypothetical protein
MPAPEYITVTAPPGRQTPVHKSDGVEFGGGGLLYVIAGQVVRVRYAKSQTIRRSIGRGDLIPCDMNGAACGVELAAAPEELPDGRIVLNEKEPATVMAEEFTPARSRAMADTMSSTGRTPK